MEGDRGVNNVPKFGLKLLSKKKKENDEKQVTQFPAEKLIVFATC